MRKPDFLCIGAQKSGTTWFHQRLRQHPELWLPPVKEIHYFDTLSLPWTKALSKATRLTKRRKTLIATFWRTPSQWKWIFYPLVDAWYLSLFQEAGNRLAGEVTPAYSALSKQSIARVHRLLPNAKIFLILRDPVERSWSQFRHMWRDGKVQFDESRLWRFFTSPGCAGRGKYKAILHRWETSYPKEQIQVLFFDDLCAEPDKFLQTALRFLGVDPNFKIRGLEAHSHQGVSLHRPAWLTRSLAKLYQPDIEWLAQRFGGWAERWRRINEGRLRSWEEHPDSAPT